MASATPSLIWEARFSHKRSKYPLGTVFALVSLVVDCSLCCASLQPKCPVEPSGFATLRKGTWSITPATENSFAFVSFGQVKEVPRGSQK